jgi:lipid-binding SYLF domain-containing protein
METQQRNTQPVPQQKPKPIVSPISPLSSYKSIIIVLCLGILLWMLLQGTKYGMKDIFRKQPKPLSTYDKAKESIKTAYEQTTDTAKNTLQDVIDRVKNGGSSMKTMYDEKMNAMQDSAQENKEYLKDKLNQVKENVVQTAKETIDSLKEKSQETVDSVKATSQAKMEQAKETLAETQENVHHMLDMQGLIEQAEATLHEFLSPHLKIEEQVPVKVLSGAKAVVFLTLIKGGVGLTGVVGTGIVIARNEIGHWSGPCAIALVGIDVGLNIGLEKSDHMIILHDDAAVRAFASKGQLNLGMDASIAAGPKGRDASFTFSIGDKGHATMVSYSIAKGVYIGLSFEGQIIVVRNDCNEQYYGKKVEATKILDGTVKPPKNKRLTQMYKTIDDYTARNLVYPEHSTGL